MPEPAADRPSPSLPRAVVRVLRPYQWVKNVLILLPLLMAHVLPWHGDVAARQWLQAVLGFVAFCLAASAIYVVNDLCDVAADRGHPVKCRRPFASGDLSTRLGFPLTTILLAAAGAIALLLPIAFAATLGIYVILSTGYSFWLKRRLLVDIFTLAGLYTLRLLAGGSAGEVAISKWLLVFSIFFFVSLAFAKRYAELVRIIAEGRSQAAGRNYGGDDLRIIESTGPASGYLAVLVLALYINDTTSAAQQLYRAPAFLWLLCPLLMYWITRIWFIAGRRVLDDDPIIFAVKDRVSWYTLVVAMGLIGLAWQPWS